MAVNLRIDPSIHPLSLICTSLHKQNCPFASSALYCIVFSLYHDRRFRIQSALSINQNTRQNETERERERERERGNDTRVSHIHTHVYDSCPGEATQRHTELSQRDIHKTEREKERERERERMRTSNDNDNENLHEEETRLQEQYGRSALRKVGVRVLPCVFLTTLVLHMDKTNMSFASEGLRTAADMDDSGYGMAASAFFITYAVCGIPASVIATRYLGVKTALPIMLVSFGSVSMLTATVTSIGGLIVLRMLLGAAEAGVVPAMLTYMGTLYGDSLGTLWELTAGLAIGVVGFFGGPLASAILSIIDGGGLEGWQWLFIIEGMPTIFVAILVVWVFPSSAHACASFLTPKEHAWLVSRSDTIEAEKQMRKMRQRRIAVAAVSEDEHEEEERGSGARVEMDTDETKTYDAGERSAEGIPEARKSSLLATSLSLVRDPRIVILMVAQFGWVILLNAVIFWAPSFLAEAAGSIERAALYIALPNLVGTLTSLVSAWSSDRTRERAFHMGGSLLVAALGFLLDAKVSSSNNPSFGASLATLAVTYGGIGAFPGPAVAAAADILPRDAAGLGFGLITTIGTLGGIAGPSTVGFIKQRSSSRGGLEWIILAIIALLTAVTVCLLRLFRSSQVQASLLVGENAPTPSGDDGSELQQHTSRSLLLSKSDVGDPPANDEATFRAV